MIFAAIDPGAVNAAIAVFHDAVPLLVDDIKTVNGMLDATALAHLLQDSKVERLAVENVHAMPKQGVSSTFRFGKGVGIIHGVAGALRIPITLVAPNQWKVFHSLPHLTEASARKEAARELAIRKWPDHNRALDRKKDADRAEALLIGDWYYVRCVIPRQEIFA
jgi:crossover junction endodeoxyribonuclease RuvC